MNENEKRIKKSLDRIAKKRIRENKIRKSSRKNAKTGYGEYYHNEWINDYNSLGKIIEAKDYKKIKRFNHNYNQYHHSYKRIVRLFNQEREIKEKYGDICLVKVDFLNENPEVTPDVFLRLMELFSNHRRMCMGIEDLILGYNYSIELTEYDRYGKELNYDLWHMHLFLYIDPCLINRHREYNKKIEVLDNILGTFSCWLQGVYCSRRAVGVELLKGCKLNFSMRIRDKNTGERVITTGMSTEDSNADRYWVSYNGKVSDRVLQYILENRRAGRNVRLFGLSTK